MPGSTHQKGGINQRERVSLIADLFLEGALRVMKRHNDPDRLGVAKPRPENRSEYNVGLTALQEMNSRLVGVQSADHARIGNTVNQESQFLLNRR
jgi:hypothetical protein